MKIICISGKARSGKDTVAAIAKSYLEKAGQKVLITHYADLLKYICRQFLAWDGQKDVAGRSLLQSVGTDIVRKQSPHFWTDFLKNILEFFPDAWDFVLIPDCRFPNEIDDLIAAGYDVIHLRLDRPDISSPLTPEQQHHPSETALDGQSWDFHIDNGGSLEELSVAVSELVAANLISRSS